MMRQAVRSKMIESASMKKLGVEGAAEAESSARPSPTAKAAVVKTRSFSMSMPVMRNNIEDLGGGKVMGHLIKGFDELSDEQSVNALRYIQVVEDYCACTRASIRLRTCTCSHVRTHAYTPIPLGCTTSMMDAMPGPCF